MWYELIEPTSIESIVLGVNDVLWATADTRCTYSACTSLQWANVPHTTGPFTYDSTYMISGKLTSITSSFFRLHPTLGLEASTAVATGDVMSLCQYQCDKIFCSQPNKTIEGGTGPNYEASDIFVEDNTYR